MKGKCNCEGSKSSHSSRSSSSCSRSSDSCSVMSCGGKGNNVCEDDACETGKFALLMLDLLLNASLNEVDPGILQGPAIVQAIDSDYGTIITKKADLVVGNTYYVVSNGEVLYYFNETPQISFPGWQTSAIPFVYTAGLATTIFGDFNSTDILGDFFSIVAYIIDRINKLCLPCCVKEKITSAVMAYVDNKLVPVNGDSQQAGLKIVSNQPFTSFCNNNKVPNCGPIYVYNWLPNDNDQEDILEANRYNVVMQFLNMVQFYLRSYFSTRCCCRDAHDRECDCKITYGDVCEFVFGRICVIDKVVPGEDRLD